MKTYNILLLESMSKILSEGVWSKKASRVNASALAIKRKQKQNSPSSYNTVPYYFPTEQVDIVAKFNRKRKKQKK